MNQHYRYQIWLSIALLWMLGGCVAIQPFPNAARAGDTITLAAGSQDGMTKSNTHVWFASDTAPSNPIEVTSGIRSIFNLFADKASRVNSPSNSFAGINFSYLHHEQWQTVIALDLPQGLPPGPGTITVQTTAPQPHYLESGPNGSYTDITQVAIRFDILPGTGSPNALQYKTTYGGTLNGDLTDMSASRQALVKPPVEDLQGVWTAGFAAIEMKINMPMTSASGTITESNMRLVPQDVSMFTGSKLQTTWKLNGNELTVLFISADGKIRYYEPRFAVVAENADFTQNPTLTSVRYFNTSGNAMTGPNLGDYSIKLQGRTY